jgi:hypothetical protein
MQSLVNHIATTWCYIYNGFSKKVHIFNRKVIYLSKMLIIKAAYGREEVHIIEIGK